MSQVRFLLMLGVIVFTVVVRMVDRPWNIAPMGGLALFTGAHFRDRRLAFAVPLLTLFAGDVALGAMHRDFAFWTFHALLPVNALCYAVSVLLGMGIQKSWKAIDSRSEAGRLTQIERTASKSLPVAGGTLAGAVIFYLVTNFGVWMVYDTYPHTAAGLLQCYEMGLPFFRNTLRSDAICVAILFAGWATLAPMLEPSRETALGPDRT